VSVYCDRLEQVLQKYDLKDKPHLIFNIDEKEITRNHAPPYFVGSKEFHPQCITSGNSQTTTFWVVVALAVWLFPLTLFLLVSA